jgi:hypothetical protein
MSLSGPAGGDRGAGRGRRRFDPGDLVVFYAQPYDRALSARQRLLAELRRAPGLRMASRAVTPTGSEPLVTTITQTLRVEFRPGVPQRSYPRPQDADHWFDTPLSPAIATGALS